MSNPLDDASAELVKPRQVTVGDLLDAISHGYLTRDTPLKLEMNHQDGTPDYAFNLFNVAFVHTNDEKALYVIVDSRSLTNAELYGEEDTLREVTFAEHHEISDAILHEHGGSCPGCGVAIPTTVAPGDECYNCDHVFSMPGITEETQEDEESDE